VFGGPSDVFPEEYPTHPSLVDLDYGEHSAQNPDYNHYAGLGGGVAYAQEMPASAQRGLVFDANQDMTEAFERDGISNKRQPGAMGSYWVPSAITRDTSTEDGDEDEDEDEDDDTDDNVRRGHQIYLGSSMKQKRKGENEVALESSLHDQLAGEDDELPDHRRSYQCAEPGLISEHRYENAWDDADGEGEDEGGRFYVEDRGGNYLPPCGHGSEYGCGDICRITGDEDLGDDSDSDSESD
jgi:hypothetical protein